MRIVYFILIFFFISCTKEVTFDIPINENNIVVNGFIEKGETAKILLTKSINPFNFNDDVTQFLDNLVDNATITISTINDTETFTALNNEVGIPFKLTDTWFYNYEGNTIKGEEGKTYYLQVIINNDTLSSKTTIPQAPIINDNDFECIYRELDDSYCYFLTTYSDPDTIGNCMSIFSKTLNSDYMQDPEDLNFDGDSFSAPFFKRVLDQSGNYTDEYINGLTFTFPLYNGTPDWWEAIESNEVDSYSGETIGFWEVNPNQEVIIKFAFMNRSSWNFWASMINNNTPGIFGTPSNVQSNITGGTGVWYGTSSSYHTLITSPKK